MARRVAALISFLSAAFWANSAWATCYFGIICIPDGNGGGPTAAPEIDVSGAFAVAALLAGIGAIAYRRLQRR